MSVCLSVRPSQKPLSLKESCLQPSCYLATMPPSQPLRTITIGQNAYQPFCPYSLPTYALLSRLLSHFGLFFFEGIPNLIGKVLEELTKKTLAQKDNVKISFFERNDQKRKIQDTLDKILKICYSYISQAKEWTNMRNKIKQKDLKYTITVMPQYLPEGFEDAAKVIVGIKTGEDQPCTVLLWRTAEYVYSALGNDIVAMEKISSETEPLNIDIMNNNGSIAVISCQGYAARHVGFCLGQYYLWDAHKTIYKQRITKKNQTPAFIYYYSGTILPSGWQVGPSPDNSKCWMFNGSSIDTPPMLGWKYWNGNEWKSDEWKSLALKIGPTLVHCENTTLSSKGSDNTAEMKPQYYTEVSQTAADRRSLYCRKRQSSIF